MSWSPWETSSGGLDTTNLNWLMIYTVEGENQVKAHEHRQDGSLLHGVEEEEGHLGLWK